MKAKKMRRFLAFGLAFALTASSLVTASESSAASKKKIKSVTLKIGKKKVTKKTYKLAKGKTAKIKVTVKPASAKKKVTFKSAKKKVATVTKKGKVTAKKVGTAKIKVTVTGKNKKKKTTWVKIKVTKKAESTTTATPTPVTSATPAANTTTKATPKPVSLTVNSDNDINPIIKDTINDKDRIHCGDPSILVDGDTVYLYAGHDVSTASEISRSIYNMPEYFCYSTKDLKNWTSHGTVLKMTDVTWTNDNTSAWAGQVMKYKGKYYMYYCSWAKTDSGKQSIGVAVADKPTGPFVDIGEPLVKGSITTDETSAFNDIDPTAWVETDDKGVEHRYLAWGNGKFFVCELNEDMISVKDTNGDKKITFGKQINGKTSEDADIIEKNVTGLSYTEAPWIYRRQDASGNYYGKYYLFHAWGWREQMAYSTTDDLMNGNLKLGSVLMEPTATSNTNHMAVFDFKGKTYFVYHNGSLPGGSGFRRIPCITELHFNEDGSIQPIPETAAGLFGKKSSIYSCNGDKISHEHYANSSSDSDYPYTKVNVGVYTTLTDEADAQWVLTAGVSDPTNKNLVSIQSENKPGLYITANEDKTVTLAQNYRVNTSTVTTYISDAKKTQTFKTVEGLADASGVSFESVSQPGLYVTLYNGALSLTDGSKKANATFYVDKKPSGNVDLAKPEITNLEVTGFTPSKSGTNYKVTVPYTTKSITASFKLKNTNTFLINGETQTELTNISLPLDSSESTTFNLYTFASDGLSTNSYTLTVTKDYSSYKFDANVVKAFDFEESTDGASAVTKAMTPVAVNNASYSYTSGIHDGKALSLTGSYGLKLSGDASKLGEDYTISFWMKPSSLGGTVDPTFVAGTFSPEFWMNLTFDAKIWSKKNNYIATPAANCYRAGEWQHVAITVDSLRPGSTSDSVYGKLYVNGVPVTSGDVAKGIMTNANSALYFGVNAWDAYFTGAVDEILLIKGTLDDRDIKEIYNGTVTASNYLPK